MAQAQRAVAQDDEQVSGAARRPIDTARHGNVEIAIWRNTGEKGEFYSASAPTIRYRDDAGEWKDGSNFGRHDLLDLAEAAREAATKIRDLQKTQSRAR
jgi:predicted heme/steroid binding protein